MKYPVLFTCALSLGSIANAARAADCEPEPPATCYPDECCRAYCIGPDTAATLASVRPFTCNGDWEFTVAGFYWNTHQDGMEYAIDNDVIFDLEELINVVDANFETPKSKWEWGFKAGIGYNTTCDGWDFGVTWTRYNGKASSHVEAEVDDNHVFLGLWATFIATDSGDVNPDFEVPTHANDIETRWNVDLDLIDIEIGRDSWLSRRISFRPHLGIRIANIRQSYEMDWHGGSWTSGTNINILNGKVDIDNDFKAVGPRGGLNTVWNIGCGWAFFGDTGLSLLYGKFNVDHDETVREAVTSFSKRKIYETEDHFRATRLAVDFAIGIQWSALFCDCGYKFTGKLGWENHLFLGQNQMWRTNRILGQPGVTPNFDDGLPQNYFAPSRGDLDTQGWTLTLTLDF